MVFVACGLNHKTASLEVREKMALSPASQDKLLHDLLGLPSINEAMILSTCNRMEIYCDMDEPHALLPWLLKHQHPDLEPLKPYFYTHQGYHGIRHTLRVASGLDSMMLGEPQILGQMKQAYHHACQVGTVKSQLRDTFEYLFSASKRIRSQSGIGNNPVSIAYAAVQLIGQLFSDYQSLRVFLIGSGETASLVAKYLHKNGVRHFCVASRTEENANSLAASFNADAITIGEIPHYLSKADIVISATACPLPFIHKGLVEHALEKRGNAPMFFLDLAVPRDIEPTVAELDNVQLYNIDDLNNLSVQGMKGRQEAAQQAEQMIEKEVDDYIRWHRSLRANKVICTYRDHIQSLALQELDRARAKLAAGIHQELVLEELCERLVNKLAHHPTTGLKQAAKDGREDLFDLTHYLYNLTSDTTLYEEIA